MMSVRNKFYYGLKREMQWDEVDGFEQKGGQPIKNGMMKLGTYTLWEENVSRTPLGLNLL